VCSRARALGKLFIEAASALGCDGDTAHFDEILKKVARHKPLPDARQRAWVPQ
jgi:hypothetical protein